MTSQEQSKHWIDYLNSMSFERQDVVFNEWSKDYDFCHEYYKDVLERLRLLTNLNFDKRMKDPTMYFIKRASIVGRHLFRKALDQTEYYFKQHYDRVLYPPELNNASFTLIYCKAIKDVEGDVEKRSKWPVYVYDTVADAIIEHSPEFFNNLDLHIILFSFDRRTVEVQH